MISDQTTSSAESRGSVGDRESKTVRRVWVFRILFLFVLCIVAAVFGVAANFFLTDSEQGLAETHYEGVVDRALAESFGILLSKRLGTISMASIASFVNPDAEDWPFVTIEGYEIVTTNLIETSNGREMGFCPLVTPEQLSDFEDFAYDYFENSRLPEPFPNGTAVNSFGKGVFGVNPALNTSDNRYKETDGSTYYNSSNKIFAPILHHNAGAHPALMLNLHFQETRGKVIDDIIACSERRAESRNLSIECGFVTDVITLTSHDKDPGPGALLMQPIYPAHNETVLTGILASSIVWGEVLENVFGSEVSGIDCVLLSDGQVHTYSVTRGVPIVKGDGDLHDTAYDEYRRDLLLTGTDLFSEDSPVYVLSLYPNSELFEVYSTHNPLVATVGTVCIIVFATLLFFLYDFFVRQEFSVRKKMLKAKRQFVRFVSHEVRTPLNSVCMGLALMQEEISSAIGIGRVEDTADMESILKSVNSQETIKCDRVAEWLPLIGEVLGNARSSVDVLNDLLNYDKVEMGSLKLELSCIPIWHVIERTAQEFKLPAMKKEIQFVSKCLSSKPGAPEREIDGKLLKGCRVVGDTVRITQVLRNLMSNALKFTPEKGEIVVRTVWMEPIVSTKEQIRSFTLQSGMTVSMIQNGNIRITVKDSGAGLTKEQVKKVFDDGVQFNVNKLQAGQGSGLGLYIAQGIVMEHEGVLSADSEGLGKGATFTMTLPLYRDAAGDNSTTIPDCDIEKPITPSRVSTTIEKLHILVVDDSGMNRKLLRRLLENRSHTCEEAKDGREAIDLVRNVGTRPYDLILMDYEMPEIDGPEATKAIRELACDSFVIGITGNLLPEDVNHFKNCGANDILPKPININALEEMVMEYGLTGRRVTARNFAPTGSQQTTGNTGSSDR